MTAGPLNPPPIDDLFGTAFPTETADGKPYYRTDLGEWFSYDSGSGVWLGELKTFSFGKGGNGHNDTYLRSQDAIGATDRGYLIPFDITIVGMTAAWASGAATGDIEVERDGTKITGLDLANDGTSTTTAENMTLSDNFDGSGAAAAGRMNVYLRSLSGTINQPTVVVWWRRRES